VSHRRFLLVSSARVAAWAARDLDGPQVPVERGVTSSIVSPMHHALLIVTPYEASFLSVRFTNCMYKYILRQPVPPRPDLLFSLLSAAPYCTFPPHTFTMSLDVQRVIITLCLPNYMTGISDVQDSTASIAGVTRKRNMIS
jgi:hypothetical protein